MNTARKSLILIVIVVASLLLQGCENTSNDGNDDKPQEEMSELYQERMAEFQKAVDTTIAWEYNNIENAKSISEWQAINPDTVCTLEIAGRHFPVMKEDSKYASHNIKGEYDVFGTPYMKEGNFPLIISHSSSWGGKGDIDLMFTFVKEYRDKEFAKNNPMMIVNRQDGTVDYYAISALMDVDITSEEQWLGWYDVNTSLIDIEDWIKRNAYVLYYDNFTEKSEFLSLYTCDLTREDARFVLVGVKVASRNDSVQTQEDANVSTNITEEGEN